MASATKMHACRKEIGWRRRGLPSLTVAVLCVIVALLQVGTSRGQGTPAPPPSFASGGIGPSPGPSPSPESGGPAPSPSYESGASPADSIGKCFSNNTCADPSLCCSTGTYCGLTPDYCGVGNCTGGPCVGHSGAEMVSVGRGFGAISAIAVVAGMILYQ